MAFLDFLYTDGLASSITDEAWKANLGWEAIIQLNPNPSPNPDTKPHIKVLILANSMLLPRLGALCTESIARGLTLGIYS